jgi:hypothetical protein
LVSYFKSPFKVSADYSIFSFFLKEKSEFSRQNRVFNAIPLAYIINIKEMGLNPAGNHQKEKRDGHNMLF